MMALGLGIGSSGCVCLGLSLESRDADFEEESRIANLREDGKEVVRVVVVWVNVCVCRNG